jgi:asparagine synthase (glutamine-hydrolysing)
MCGIAGYHGFNDNQLVKNMSKDLEHRGPDGEGIFSHAAVTLLSRRLAIIDRKGGDQPIFNEDKTVVVVYNGEIYNYRELRKELEAAGHRFSTHSDTECIVHGYEEWGDDCFDRFNGMFGAALYDIKRKRLLVVRDHFGIKPLYYAFDKDDSKKLIFSSEIKPILNSGRIEKKPNDRVIYRYLTYRIHDEGEETFFEGVKRLLPGHMMIVEDGSITIRSYTELREDILKQERKERVTEEDIALFRDKLTDAIRMRLVSEVPVGTCLSGGLDSSTVVAVANRLLREKNADAASLGKTQKAYSAVFPGSVNDEERYVDDLIGRLDHIDSVKVLPKPEEFFQDLEDFVTYQEEPTISTGPYAQYQVMRRAHKDVTVLLDGQGADEMMAGYLPYYFVYLKQLLKQGKFGTLIAEIAASFDILRKLALQKLTYSSGLKKSIPVRTLLNQTFAQTHADERFTVVPDDLRARLAEDIFGNSLQALLRYEDKNAMRFSIEGRVPFLDFNLVRFIFSLPDEAIIGGGWNKSIMRKAFADILPESIHTRRNKIGFTTPEHEWFIRMKNRIYHLFLSESFANRKYFNQAEVLKAFEQFIQGKNDDTMMFWRMLNVEMWLRIFFDEKIAPQKKKEKGLFEANEGKAIGIEANGKMVSRFPVRTALFEKGDDYPVKIREEVLAFRRYLAKDKANKHLKDTPWLTIVSEKVVAISQGRSYFIWDINPGFWAKTLSRFVRRTPYGIGLGSPWTMQLAIGEVGLPRILLATVASALTRPFGVRGVFYRIAGRAAASIDGPTEYSLYPSNVSAKLGPKDPKKAAQRIFHSIKNGLPEQDKKTFKGVVIIDANDLGRDILGNASDLADAEIAELMRDNPMGQGSERTPVVVAIEG